MNAPKLLTTVVAAATILGGASLVYAQSTSTDPNSAPADTTATMPAATAPAAADTTMPAAAPAATDSSATTPAPADTSSTNAMEPAPKADRN